MIRYRLPAGLLLAGLGLLLAPAPAQAHPLGNFTTNQYAGLRVTAHGVDVDYLLDLAELPAYQAQREDIDADHDGTPTPAERTAYAGHTCAAVAAASTVTVGGAVTPLTARPVALSLPPGAGGLATLRLQCVLHADARITGETTIGYRGTFLADRIGWREVTAVGDRYTVLRSTVPAASPSARLTGYPTATVTSDVRSAELTVRPGGPAAAPIVGDPAAGAAGARAAGAGAPAGAGRLTRWFTDLVGRPTLTLGVGLVAFLVALVLGGAHAVAPGHGKTIMAAYLVGSRGRLAQALTVAGTVAATHTAGVLALGVVLAASLQLAPQDLYEWLRLASGILVALVGAHLLHRAIRTMRAAARHAHDHTHGHPHTHEHTHTHGGGRPHSHHPPAAGEPLRLRTLLAMGFAGGLSPSPSAVVVLLGAAALGRAWYGVLLVLAYGIGLAVTLTGIGFALARWGERLRLTGTGRWTRLLMHRMPTATAATILAVGLGMITLAAVGLLATNG